MREVVAQVAGDVRVAMRSLRRAPGLLLITVLSLGVGIGAMTAIFGVVDTLVFQGTPGVADPDGLVAIYTSQDDGDEWGATSLPDYRDIVAEVGDVEDASATAIRVLSGGEPGASKSLLADEVTGNYFELTGIRPVLGRTFVAEEAAVESGRRVAVIGYDLWQRDYAGRPSVLGTSLRLNGYPHTIVGVLPDGVLSRTVPLEPDVWVLLGGVGDDATVGASARRARDRRSYRVLARLKPGGSPESLSGQLDVLAARLRAEYPREWVDHAGRPRAFSVLGERQATLGVMGRRITGAVAAFFFAAAGLVLLIACANVTTLFLARASHRRREMAVRVSLGASRSRLVAMFLTEGLVPGLGAAAVGLAVAAGINGMINAAVASIPFGVPIRVGFDLDGRVVVVAFLLALISSLVFGLAPALEGSRPDLVRGLKDESRRSRAGRWGARDVLVVGQCAAAVILLVGASLFVRALGNAADVDVGLDPERIAIATKQLDTEGFGVDEGQAYIRAVQESLTSRPDVEQAHVARYLEMTFTAINPTLQVEVVGAEVDATTGEVPDFWRNSVTPGYLEMMGVVLLRGRALRSTDVAGAPLVAVVNETFAQRMWPGEEAMGQTFDFFGRAPSGSSEAVTATRSFQVIGVVEDGKYFDFDDGPTPYFWTSIFQDYAARVVIAAKGTESAEGMIPVLREHVALAPGEVQFTPPGTLARQYSYQFVHLRVAAGVLRWASAFGLFLAVIGIYGIVSFAVTSRNREMAVRMAIGAEHRTVLRGVMLDGMRPALLGLVVGAFAAFLGARLLTTVLVDVSALDPLSFAAGTSILVTAALVASFVPARRALRIDPMGTLRDE